MEFFQTIWYWKKGRKKRKERSPALEFSQQLWQNCKYLILCGWDSTAHGSRFTGPLSIIPQTPPHHSPPTCWSHLFDHLGLHSRLGQSTAPVSGGRWVTRKRHEWGGPRRQWLRDWGKSAVVNHGSLSLNWTGQNLCHTHTCRWRSQKVRATESKFFALLITVYPPPTTHNPMSGLKSVLQEYLTSEGKDEAHEDCYPSATEEWIKMGTRGGMPKPKVRRWPVKWLASNRRVISQVLSWGNLNRRRQVGSSWSTEIWGGEGRESLCRSCCYKEAKSMNEPNGGEWVSQLLSELRGKHPGKGSNLKAEKLFCPREGQQESSRFSRSCFCAAHPLWWQWPLQAQMSYQLGVITATASWVYDGVERRQSTQSTEHHAGQLSSSSMTFLRLLFYNSC